MQFSTLDILGIVGGVLTIAGIIGGWLLYIYKMKADIDAVREELKSVTDQLRHRVDSNQNSVEHNQQRIDTLADQKNELAKTNTLFQEKIMRLEQDMGEVKDTANQILKILMQQSN